MNVSQIARLHYLTEILENVDTDLFIYSDTDDYCTMRTFLEIDRIRAEKQLMDYMREMLK